VCSKEEFRERARKRKRERERAREKESERDHCLLQRGVGSRMGRQHQWRHLVSSSSIFFHTRSRMELVVETLGVLKQQGANQIAAAIENARAGLERLATPKYSSAGVNGRDWIPYILEGSFWVAMFGESFPSTRGLCFRPSQLFIIRKSNEE
jgi:hypothetical protein